jgi:hypothetical protein
MAQGAAAAQQSGDLPEGRDPRSTGGIDRAVLADAAITLTEAALPPEPA